VPLTARILLAVAVLSNGSIERQSVELDHDVSDVVVAAASARLAAHLTGTTLGRTGDMPSSGDDAVDVLTASAQAALAAESRRDDDQVFVGGAARMASAFDAVDVVRAVLLTLEQQYVVVTLMRDVLDRGLTVAIGAEHGVEPLASCSVVVAPYVVEGEAVGTIGVLGPTRMNYPQSLAVVDAVSERLGRRLSES
jgi:heat-inducible transcriptional repressor